MTRVNIELRTKVHNLREEGYTHREIARTLDINPGQVTGALRPLKREYLTEAEKQAKAEAKAQAKADWKAGAADRARATARAYNKRPEVRARVNAHYQLNKKQIKANTTAWLEAQGFTSTHQYRLSLPSAAAYKSQLAARSLNIEKEYKALNLTERKAVDAIYAHRDTLNEAAGCIAYHVDHIYPRALGGAHHPSNLRVITAEENLRKGAKIDY